MKHFLDTVETIPAGLGFSLFGAKHLLWLAAAAVFLIWICRRYRRSDSKKREKMRRIVAAAIVADELFKMVCLAIGGRYAVSYLPFHLCSINIFVCALHAWRPRRAVGDYLYLICIPAAFIPLLTPTWAELPMVNFMVWHSFSVHALLVAYPLMQTVGGDIRPRLKTIPASLAVLAILAAAALIVNLIFDTNFMFMMYAEPGTPLVFFEELLGHHLAGFFVLIPAVLALMMVPILLTNRKKTAA